MYLDWTKYELLEYPVPLPKRHGQQLAFSQLETGPPALSQCWVEVFLELVEGLQPHCYEEVSLELEVL